VSVAHLLSPGDPDQRTGGYLYNARLVAALRRRGWRVEVHAVPGRWPWPEGDAHRPMLEALPAGPVIADGLLWAGAAAPHLAPRTVVVVHSPLGVEGDPGLQQAEVRALRGVAAVVSTGGPTQRALAGLGVASVCLPPGVARRPQRPEPPVVDHVEMLALATVTPRKRVDQLVQAVAAVPGCRLTVAGSLTRDPPTVRGVRARIAALGVGERVRLVGEVGRDEVERLLRGSHLLVHAAEFEAWGMALSEAMAHGVPVLSTPAGALEGGGGRVVSIDALPRALAELVAQPSARAALGARGWQAARALPTWDELAARYASLMEAM